MDLLDEREVEQLRAIADRIRDQGEHVGYGYFPGGDPRNFTPDPECCTEQEIKNWERACELMAEGKIDEASGQHHWPIIGKDGDVIGHTTSCPFGMGTYSLPDPDAQALARQLDAWLDEVRKLEDMYR
jgi:hypothetical protein